MIKKIDIFVMKKYLLLLAGSFFVCLFVFIMQSAWLFIDDLVGKGLTLTVLAQFFWYLSLTLVPTSLPLAVLLASLITFGNMGESLELLSMKAAGISLLRIMAPMAILCALLAGVSFEFQNQISPHAQITMRSMLLSMRQASPALEIPEGVFYSGVPNVNLYVQSKDAKTGMLYQVIIYKTDQGFDRAQIVLADSALMEMTADKMHLTLDLWSGEQFENLQGGGTQALGNVPYDRETFQYKRFIIDFDSNFNMLDADMLKGMASAKSLRQLDHDIDSLAVAVDSIGRANRRETFDTRLPISIVKSSSTKKQATRAATAPKAGRGEDFDTMLSQLSESARAQALQSAASQISQLRMDYEWRKDMSRDTMTYMRVHHIEWHKKLTLSLACLLFFFIGAPLGAVIGKGGLGLPTIVSVLIFILYYIVNTSGMKMGRQGDIAVWLGMWASTFIMLPCGAWITYKAQLDKMTINISSIWNKIKRFPLWRLFQRPWKNSARATWS